jgi:Tetratricopeptide repeat.
MVPFARFGVSLALSLSIAFAPAVPFLSTSAAQAQQKLNDADLAKLKANVEKSRSGKKDALALNLYYLGQALAEVRRFDEALPCLKEAAELDRSLNQSEQLLFDVIAIGTVQMFQEQYPESEKSYLEALQLAQTAKSDKQIANCYNYLGKWGSYSGNYQKAQQYYEKAVEAAQKAGAFVSEAQARISLTQLLKIKWKNTRG